MNLVGLDYAEMECVARLESVIAVELEGRRAEEIGADLGRQEVGDEGRVERLADGEAAVVEWLVRLLHEIALDDEEELAHGMIEVRLDSRDRLVPCNADRGCILDLCDEILLGLAHKAPALLHVEIHIVAPQHHVRDLGGGDLEAAAHVGDEIRTPE